MWPQEQRIVMEQQNAHIDPSFISLLQKGDKAAFETLFRLYYDKLTYIARNYLVRAEDAEGIVQNVFLYLWDKRGNLSDITNINAYLYTLVKRGCLDQLRHEKVKRNFIDDALYKTKLIQYGFVKDQAASLLLENELGQKILEGVELLPNKCREVFVKSRMEGLKHKEIAEELGISHKTVDNHIAKALAHMRLHLKDFLSLFL